MKRNHACVTIVVFFIVVCLLEGSMQRARGSMEQSATPEVSSVYVLAGEFRTVFANLLWIKADDYLHEYISHGGDAFENKEAMPMIRLITQLDPHFIEAYRTGAMILYVGLDKPAEAEKFIREGISHNPKSWELYEELGMYYARYKKDLRGSLPYFEKASELCRDWFYRKKINRLIKSIKRDLKEEQESR